MRAKNGYRQKSRHNLTAKERREIAQWRALGELTPEQWVERVAGLPAPARPQIARMIWWDWWSERKVGERWPHFDKYLEFDAVEDANPLSTRMIAKCLKAVGYPPYRVKLRLLASQ